MSIAKVETVRSHSKTMQNRDTLNAKYVAALNKREIVEEIAISRAADVAQSTGEPLHKALVELGLCDEDRAAALLAEVLEIPLIIDPIFSDFDADLCAHLDLEVLKRGHWIPLKASDGSRPILLTDPTNETLLAEITFFLDCRVRPIVGTKTTVTRALSAVETGLKSDKPATDTAQSERDIDRFNEAKSDGPTVRFVQAMLASAIDSQASDVHIERAESGLKIRYRIHGVLQQQTIDRSVDADALVARVKVLAGMNVAEKRLPQDGRIGHAHAGRNIDVRVSSVPTEYGESLVCRLLDPGALRLNWSELGFDPGTEHDIKSILAEPNGLFLVTGPTGSGKTTTLYTCLNHLASETRKIITVEDPIEYRLNGIEQVPINTATGLDFATVLRSVLRQDPDVIMIGEIRDAETAEIACRAAMVGRLVLSTLHTNSAAEAPQRLVDLGVESYLVSSVLRATLGQTLINRSGERRALNYELL